MQNTQPEWLGEVEQVAARTDDPEIAILAKAILRLAGRTQSQRDNNLVAFEQIEELSRRQEADNSST